MAVIGAVLGDIAGSQYEVNRPDDLNPETCNLFTDSCRFTDDTVMTLAIKYALKEHRPMAEVMQKMGRQYPDCGYGSAFKKWIRSDVPEPYSSFGNGAAMRVSYIGEAFADREETKRIAEKSAMVSHSHPEGVKGACVTAQCIWMAGHRYPKDEIYDFMLSEYPEERYEYSNKSMTFLREHHKWDATCMTSVPVALRCFYESSSYESFLRNVFSLNCDMDTICAIGGGIAEEYYGSTGFDDRKLLEKYLDKDLLDIILA